ncbi:carboxyl-terminal processing protease [Hansschlegelia beijingensis]|uniref:Carboxyl-terminal processing protease n=2 Tax=Hansschlegelia beijingensis TaxID=1133344 RepID=A0A7W6D579_9HYPH|nr:S41 family peptidase [Hansschlegelia beijingensis]MBB3973393.1 carboxyl-terminal processing protease [Hansschlegelia beijingensis]
MRKVSLILFGAVIGASAAGMALQPRAFFGSVAEAAGAADTYRQLNLFGDVFERVRADYVEKPDDAKLVESAINGMLSGLDPHSSYMDAKAFKEMRTNTDGEFGGLGIKVQMFENAIRVEGAIDDTPAARAGIRAKDVITKLDGEPVDGLSLEQAVDKMRGPVNTPITLTIQREGQEKPLEVKIVRDKIKLDSVKWELAGDDIGYIRVSQFNATTFEGLSKAIDQISDKAGDKLKGYVVDLRNNPGGLLDQAIAVSDAFLERGEIVSTRGRNPDESQRFNARSGDLAKGKPVIVLINGGSASASEIVAGALQDQKRATILGTRSFGKGSVQTIIPLGTAGAIRLTTARYYTPSGKSIQAKGIMPDIEVGQDIPDDVKGKDETKGEAGLKGHLKNGEQEQSGSSAYIPPERKDDKQLNYAFDLMHGIQSNANFPPQNKTSAN